MSKIGVERQARRLARLSNPQARLAVGEQLVATLERIERRNREAQETAETLIEDRGLANARAWAIHCANRTTDGFWSRVVIAIENIDSSQEERSYYDA